MTKANASFGARLEPAFLVSLAGIVVYYAGFSLANARFLKYGIPAGEIHLQVEQYLLAGLAPAAILAIPLVFVADFSRNPRARPKVGSVGVAYPALLLALSHVIDGEYLEAVSWIGLGTLIGWVWWRRLERGFTFVELHWVERIPYAAMIILAAAHVGSALGHLDAEHDTLDQVHVEMVSEDHPLHNSTAGLIAHHASTYYFRLDAPPSEGRTVSIPDTLVRLVEYQPG